MRACREVWVVFERRTVLAGLGVGLLLVLLALGGLLVAGAFGEPTVVAVESEWGEVTDEAATIHTTVVVDNPNPVGIPPVVNLQYNVTMNAVHVAAGEREGVGFPPGETEIELSTTMAHRGIAAWWPTHVERLERSSMTIRPRVTLRWVGTEFPVPAEREPLQTDVLAPINDGPDEPVEVLDPPHVVVLRQSARWAAPTAERTPIHVETVVENRFETTARVEDVRYRVRLNDVVVAAGEDTTAFDLQPSSTSSVEVTIPIENDRMADWWASHLRNDERTVVSIEISAVVSAEGRSERVPLQAAEETSTIETDVLGRSGE